VVAAKPQVADTSGAPALCLRGISKSFDGLQALQGASFTLGTGEVHALLGENGAGKSTLMNVACGLYTADAGSITLQDQNVTVNSPSDATRLGLGMVHQHYKLVGAFSVAENILLSCGDTLRIKTPQQAAQLCQRAARDTGFEIDPHGRVDSLSVAERQRIEIVKLVLLGTRVLILDEPTAVLTDAEADSVLTMMRSMAEAGKSVVLITHRLRDVRQFADRVTIMRDGTTVCGPVAASSLSESELANLMVGEEMQQPDKSEPLSMQHIDRQLRLQLDSLTAKKVDGVAALQNVSINVTSGQLIGIAGIGGNGQTELTELIAGLIEPASGRVLADGQEITHCSIAERRNRGVRVVPADRFAYALIGELKAYENLALPEIPNNRFGGVFKLSRRRMKKAASVLFSQANVVGGKSTTRTRLFSGGNAQKLLLARELTEGTSVLVVHSPTRGLDVRACQAVHEAIVASVEAGAACLLISEDLDEVLALSTHVAVLSRGQLQGPWPADEVNRARVGELMSGHQ